MDNSRRRRLPRRVSSSNLSNRRRRMSNSVRPTTISDLPPEIIHSLMLHVNDFEVHTRARATGSLLRNVTDEEAYLRDVDLFLMHTSNDDPASIWNFRLTCHHRGNFSALFLHGCSEFFFRGNVDNGFAMIRQSALSNYELAIYVYSMLRRIMNPHPGLDLHLMYPDRNLVRRMRKRVKDARELWGPEQLPELYEERCNTFDSGVLYRCGCAELNLWVPIHVESVKGPDMCDFCFTTIHAIAFSKYFPTRIYRWPLQYEF